MARDRSSILIAEDDRGAREGMAAALRKDYDIQLAEDGLRAVNMLKRNDYDLVLSDIRMPGADGLEILRQCLAKSPPTPCVMITAYPSVQTAVDAMKAGATDFIPKPVALDHLEIVVRKAIESKRLREENEELRSRLDRRYGVDSIIGDSPPMREVVDMIRRIAPAKSTVLVTGESGTGKELVAQALHTLSGRRGQFVVVHCAALPSNLLESELFGHERGAFTGAVETRHGRFEAADGGTIFLDEIGEIDPATQVKLLRVLESKSFERVGGSASIHVEARVVAATNRNLKAMAARGEFREDLLYRLDVLNIHLPPLRERPGDVSKLVSHFMEHYAAENGKRIDGINDDAMALLLGYSWPGNIRELRNCVERMVVLSRGGALGADDVPEFVRHAAPRLKATPEADELDVRSNEMALVSRALDASNGNRTLAAAKLGISRRTLQRKLKDTGSNV